MTRREVTIRIVSGIPTILLGLAGPTPAGAGIVEAARRQRRRAGRGCGRWAALRIGALAAADPLFLLSGRPTVGHRRRGRRRRERRRGR